MRHSFAVLLLAPLFAALPCEPVNAQAPRIVENPRSTWKPAEALRLSAAPLMVIGTRPGEMYEFNRIEGSARLKDGRIVVADGGSASLRYFDSTGTFLKAVGRKGGGPGEFQELQALFVVPGDTLVAGAIYGDLSWFTPDGKYLERRGTRNPPIDVAKAGMAVVLTPVDGSGSRAVGVFSRAAPHAAGSTWVDSMPVVIVDGSNREVAKIGNVPSMEMAMDADGPRPPWFGATAVAASGGGHLYLGYGGEYAIRVYSTSGALQQIIRRAWTPVKVTTSEIDRYVVEWGKRWIKSTGAAAEAERKDLRDDPYAARVPAFSRFIPDRVGRLWVREAHVADAPGAGELNTIPLAPSKWSVFNAQGVWLGDVSMPARFMPTDIGANYVLGKAMDDDGVQTIAMYRLGTAKDLH